MHRGRVSHNVTSAGSRVQIRVVYYLEGDERRAIRRFIEENEAHLSTALQKNRNRFQTEWSEFLYGLIEEEWRFWVCEQGAPDTSE